MIYALLCNKSCSRCLLPQSTYIPRVHCLSPCPNWDPPPSLPQASVSPPEPKEGEGEGGPNSDDWRKSLQHSAYYQTVPFPAPLLQTEKFCSLLPKSTLVTLFHLLLHIKNPFSNINCGDISSILFSRFSSPRRGGNIGFNQEQNQNSNRSEKINRNKQMQF